MTSIPASTINTLNFKLSSQDIEQLSAKLIQDQKKVNDDIAQLDPTKCTFDSVIKALGTSENNFSTLGSPATFLRYVSMEKSVRDASTEANQKMDAFEIEQSMREDVYEAVKRAVQQTRVDSLSEEDKRLMNKIELEFKRNGLDLPEDKRTLLKQHQQRLSELKTQFSKNVNEDDTKIEFTREELEGLSDDFLSGLKKTTVDGVEKYIVTMKYPDLIPVLKMAKKEETRKALDIANSTRCKENIAMLEEAVELRRECAKLLGYKAHTHYKLEVKMAKTEEGVLKFLQELQTKLKPLALKELAVLKELKQKEKESRGEVYDGSFNSWDFQYYNRLLLEEKYQVNHEKIKEYFSFDSVTKGMLALYEKVLGLKFTQTTKYPSWHEDVQCVQVEDAQSGEFVGIFYLDLFPRDNKYTHAACFPLQPGFELEQGGRRYPIAGMVANFSKPTPDKPSLLKHDEVVTYYHELGHVMHELCSKTKWSRFHGTRTEWDFVEAPSQMLENWCWEPSVLSSLSSHYKNPDEKLPQELIDNLVKSKNVNEGLMTLRQIFFATYDMKLHGAEKQDVHDLWHTLRSDITLIPSIPDTFPYSTFGHIMGGYDAGYYGYLWSQVFSADMFYSKFKNSAVMGGQAGLDYRHKVLGPGGSRDGMDLLKGFLGREPTPDAFLKSLGIASA